LKTVKRKTGQPEEAPHTLGPPIAAIGKNLGGNFEEGQPAPADRGVERKKRTRDQGTGK